MYDQEEQQESWQVTGDFGVYDEEGNVIYNHEGTILTDLDNNHLTYDDQGKLENTNVSLEVAEFIHKNSL